MSIGANLATRVLQLNPEGALHRTFAPGKMNKRPVDDGEGEGLHYTGYP